MIRVVAERGALSEEQIRKLLRVRGGQVRRLLVTPVETDQAAWTLHLTRVSQADIRVGAGRLRMVPGVQSVEVSRKGRSSDEEANGSSLDG